MKNKNSEIDKKELITFKSTDLQGSLNNCTITIKGKLTEERGKLNVQIYDIYDFKYEKDYFTGIKGFIFTIGNNLAWADQYANIINTYKIYIEFDYDV